VDRIYILFSGKMELILKMPEQAKKKEEGEESARCLANGGIPSLSVYGEGFECKRDEISVDIVEGEGSVFGEDQMLLEDQIWNYKAVALDQVTLFSVTKEAVLLKMRTLPDLAQKVTVRTTELSGKKKDKSGYVQMGYRKVYTHNSNDEDKPYKQYCMRAIWKYIYFVRFYKTKDFKFTNILELVKKQIAEEDARREKQIGTITTLLKPTIM
jgi:hypothetical protein